MKSIEMESKYDISKTERVGLMTKRRFREDPAFGPVGWRWDDNNDNNI
jgi:hypothetical protein